MSNSPRDGILDGINSGVRWPVFHWKSPRVAAANSQQTDIPGPARADAAVAWALEFGAAGDGFDIGDHMRGLHGSPVAGGVGWHPIWNAPLRQLGIRSSTQAAGFINKTTGSGGVSYAVANRFIRLYASWPLISANYNNPLRVARDKLYENRNGIGILRRRAVTPWVPGTFNGPVEFDMRQYGANDEPALLTLWGRCIHPDNAFRVGDEIQLNGNDASPAGGGEVWHNGSRVGFYNPSTGWKVVNADAPATLVALTPARWVFQLRMAWASDPQEAFTQKEAERHRWISWHATPWRQPIFNSLVPFVLPEQFQPIDISPALQCVVADGAYVPGDNFLGWAGTGNGNLLFPCIIKRGRNLLLPIGTTPALLGKDTAALSITAIRWKVQLRCLG